MRTIFIFIILFPLSCVKAQSDTIDFFLINNKIYVKNVIINNKSYSGFFLIDTGSDTTLLNKNLIQQSNIRKSNRKINTYYGKISSNNTYVDISINGFHFDNIKVDFTYGYIFSDNCYVNNIIGIIGRDIISRYSWKFDMKNKKITISNTPFNTYSYNSIPIKKEGKYSKLFIEIVYNNKPHKLLLDTGSSVDINLKPSNNNFQKYSAFGNKIDQVSYKNDSILINDIKYKSIIYFSKYLKPSIGLGFLQRYNWIINENDNHLYILNHSNFEPKNINYKYGFSVMCRNENMVISDVYKGSIAEQKGIKVFDKIRKINDIYIEKCKCDLLDKMPSIFDKSEMIIELNNGKIINLYINEK